MKKLTRDEMKNVLGGMLPGQRLLKCQCPGETGFHVATCIDGIAACPELCTVVWPGGDEGCSNG